MISSDYSQSGEQEAILKAIEGMPPGRFLDIGAGDGETFSNTRALALARWSGVLVEPAAWAFAKLLALYDGTIAQCCSALVTADYCGPMKFLYSQDDHLSTLEPAHAAAWSQVPFKPVTAAAITVAQLLDWFEGRFSVVSIDAEGRTAELVRAYQEHPSWADVRVLCLERERGLPVRELQVASWQLVAQTPNNVVLVR